MFYFPEVLPRISGTRLTGVLSPGSAPIDDIADRNPSRRFALRKRMRKEVTPEEVRYAAHLNAEQDTHGPNDAEAIW